MRAVPKRKVVPAVVTLLLAVPAYGQSLPSGLVGGWDISLASCAAEGTPLTRIDIASQRIKTFGGNAVIREVEQIGDVTFAAADFQQLEGVAEVTPSERTYFRFDRSAGPDRLRFVWKDVETVDLVRCDTGASEESSVPFPPNFPVLTGPVYDGPLPIPLGLWVVAGTPYQSPSNASWRVYHVAGLRGAASTRCEIDATQRQGNRIIFSQLCASTYNGEVVRTRDHITITEPHRVVLVEGGEDEARDFDWCGPQLQP